MHSKYHRNLNREKEECKGNLGVAVRSRQRSRWESRKKEASRHRWKGEVGSEEETILPSMLVLI